MKTIVISGLLFLSLILAAQTKYENLEYGFKINFPDGWIIKNSTQKYTLIKAVHSSNTNISYISIAAYPIDNGNLEFYKNESPQEMFNLLKEEENIEGELLDSGLKIIDGKRTVWTKVKMHVLESTFLITSNYHIVYNGILFRITNATDGGEKSYEELKPIFEKSVYSLDFK